MTAVITARFKLDYEAFHLDVDLSLPSSGITVLYGESGSGKTTLLRCIAGLEHAPQAYLEVNQQVWQDSISGLFLPTYRRALGYVFQDALLFPHLSVADNLAFGLKRIKNNVGTTDLKTVVELLGIGSLLKRLPERLSGGERQRVAIARALVLNPDILLMDEPLASLDAKRKQEILPFLKRLHQELTIPMLYVTHDQQEVTQLADTLIILSNGVVQTSGTIEEMQNRVDVSLAEERDATTVWQATIAEHESNYHLTRVDFLGGSISLPTIAANIGTPLRIQIYARDVSITLEPSMASSILNVLAATITDITDDNQGRSSISLQIGNQTLLAHITHKSAVLLKLQLGMKVYAQIKGISILN